MTRALGPGGYKSAETRRFEKLEVEIKKLKARVDELEKVTSPHALAGNDLSY